MANLRNGRRGKDFKPREMAEGSLANIRRAVAGFRSAVVRIYGPSGAVRWFEGLNSIERGEAIQCAQKQYDVA